ncbi:hypothetical protein EK904_014190 [Melospiza melodia maxima]|nr:hypothetical protein EK904_014190 [Melospiza melodia maxima]
MGMRKATRDACTTLCLAKMMLSERVNITVARPRMYFITVVPLRVDERVRVGSPHFELVQPARQQVVDYARVGDDFLGPTVSWFCLTVICHQLDLQLPSLQVGLLTLSEPLELGPGLARERLYPIKNRRLLRVERKSDGRV